MKQRQQPATSSSTLWLDVIGLLMLGGCAALSYYLFRDDADELAKWVMTRLDFVADYSLPVVHALDEVVDGVSDWVARQMPIWQYRLDMAIYEIARWVSEQ